MRYYMSLLQMYLENIDYFDNNLIKSWQNEIKPFIYQKYPIVKEGLFNINSDLYYLIQIIDSFKDKYDEKQKELKKKELEIQNTKNNNDLITTPDNLTNSNKKTNNNCEEEEEEVVHHKSINFFKKDKRRRGTGQNLLELENYQSFRKKKKSAAVIENNKLEIKEDNQIVKEDKMSKMNMIILEFIEENILPPKRTNSMHSIRPHSHTINSKTTRDSSVKEDNLNFNINKFLLSTDVNNNNKDTNKKKEINMHFDSTKEVNNNKSAEKGSMKMYGNIFTNEEQTNRERNSKLKIHLRSRSINLLREMNPIYKDEVEAEGYSIIKNKDKKLSFIYPDILLKKIIFEDFIKNNILLIHHFCQQCFCFVNKEIFFRKLFYCYNFYKKNTSKTKLNNLIEFINILVIEMFQYYQKIDLSEIYVSHIIKYYNELITDLILSIENNINNNNNNNNNNSDDNENEDNIFRFESIDYLKSELNLNRNSNVNYNYIIDRSNLINMNLNIEIKDIKIFIFTEKENDEKKKIKEKEKNKENDNKNINKNQNEESNIIKSLTFIPSSIQNIKGEILLKEDEKTENLRFKNQSKTTKSDKEIDLWNLEEVEEKRIEENIDINKEKKKDNNEQNEKNEEKKQKFFKISKTLRKSNMTIKKAIHDAIIEEEDDLKDKSEDENKSLYSLKSNSESKKSSSSSSSRIESENENDKNEENSNKNIFNFNRNYTKDMKGKEEDNKKKLEIIKNILHKSDIPDNLLSINEKILNELKYIIILFDNETNGEPGYIDIKEAKDNIIFYKNLQYILNKQKKIAIFPNQAQKRLTKSYSSFFNLGTIASKSKASRDYLKKGYFCVIDWKTQEIGNQLMKVSKSLLNRINPRELYKAIFLKKEKEKTSPNVVECINKFNRLTSFIIEDILSYDYPKERARIYEKWVDIADYCKNNKDYNDLIAIFSALNHYVVTGLQLTLKEVRSRTNTTFRNISDFCSVEGNYRKIREDMNNCDRSGIIYIPYLGMLMRDINFFEESSKYINENGCINIEKIEKIHELFENCFKFKYFPDKKNRIKELNFFEELEDISEEKLEEMANKLEPEFTLDDIQKPGKRLTNIDRIYFEDYKVNMRDINLSGRKTTLFGKY